MSTSFFPKIIGFFNLFEKQSGLIREAQVSGGMRK